MVEIDITHLTSIVNHPSLMDKFARLQVLPSHSQDDLFLLLPVSDNKEEEEKKSKKKSTQEVENRERNHSETEREEERIEDLFNRKTLDGYCAWTAIKREQYKNR